MENVNIDTAAPKGPSELIQAEDGLKNIGYYKQILSEGLAPEVFRNNPKRLFWYGACLSGSLICFFAICLLHLPWFAKLGLGIALGLCNGTMGFVCHELLHGSIVKNQKIQNILGFFGAIPFFVSPTFWKFWHNRLHHGKTQQLIRDPDAFPNLKIYKSSGFMKFMFPFTPGSGHRRSVAYFFFWFSFHNFVAQLYLRFRNKIFEALDQKQVTLEFGAQVLIGAGLLIFAGPRNWLWVFFVPLLFQNYLLMSYISTNHNLSPLTPENDPLVNSLSVTNHPVLEFLNLNFGYHVEHHIFPTVGGARIKDVYRELKKKFPEKYKVMSKGKAMKALYSTPRIYLNAHELINPETLAKSPTL